MAPFAELVLTLKVGQPLGLKDLNSTSSPKSNSSLKLGLFFVVVTCAMEQFSVVQVRVQIGFYILFLFCRSK